MAGDFDAASGNMEDVQAAVNQANNAGGGNVFIPEDKWYWHIPPTPTGIRNYPRGVNVPGGVNVFGMGVGRTIIEHDSAYGTNYSLFDGNGSNNKPIRFSGMTLKSIVETENSSGLNGIALVGVRDYRVDHMEFTDLDNSGVYATNNWVLNPTGNCGVVDHCTFDNPYKDTYFQRTGSYAIWGYGVIAGGTYNVWEPNLANLFGKYHRDVMFVEDCSFRRSRHCYAGANADQGFGVIRHCTFTDNISAYMGSFLDDHGGSRGFECYDNTITNVPVDIRSLPSQYWGQYSGLGINPRGGCGLFYHNTFVNFPNTGTAIMLSNDQSNNPTWRTTGIWIWENYYTNSDSSIGTNPGGFSITKDVDYFLRQPNQAQDGFTYTAYPYPHPLVGAAPTQGVLSVNATIPNIGFNLQKMS